MQKKPMFPSGCDTGTSVNYFDVIKEIAMIQPPTPKISNADGIMEARMSGDPIYIVDDKEDAALLCELGVCATYWPIADISCFRDAAVVVFASNRAGSKTYADSLCAKLYKIVIGVILVDMNMGLREWARSFSGVEQVKRELFAMVGAVSLYTPPPDASYWADPVVITIKSILQEHPSGIRLKSGDFFLSMAKYVGEYAGLLPDTVNGYIQNIADDLLKNDEIIYTFEKKMHGFAYRGRGQLSFENSK